MLRFNDILNELHGFCMFSKIDLKISYHKIKMKEGDGGKNNFDTKYGLFEWLFVLFSLIITHYSLMRLMNHILYAFISSFVIDYFDHIHSKNLDEHIENLRFLFNLSQKKLLCANILNWRNYSQFTIVYGLTLLDLIYLLADERVRLDGNRKA